MTPSLFGVSLIQHTLWRFVKGEVQLYKEILSERRDGKSD